MCHTPHIQINWQLWAYTYTFHPRYVIIIMATTCSAWIITCHICSIYVKQICSYYLRFRIMYLIHVHQIFSHNISSWFIRFHPIHGPSMARLLKTQPSPWAQARAHAEGWKVEPSTKTGAPNISFWGPWGVNSGDLFRQGLENGSQPMSLVLWYVSSQYYVCWVPRDHATPLLFWQYNCLCILQQNYNWTWINWVKHQQGKIEVDWNERSSMK